MVSNPRDLHQPPPPVISSRPSPACCAGLWFGGAEHQDPASFSWPCKELARKGGVQGGAVPPDLAINCRGRGPTILLWHPGLQQGGQRGGGRGSAGCRGAAGGGAGCWGGAADPFWPSTAAARRRGGCQVPELMGGSPEAPWAPSPHVPGFPRGLELAPSGDAGAGGFSLPPLPPNPTYFFICPYGVGRRYGMLRSMYFWAGTPTPGSWCWC